MMFYIEFIHDEENTPHGDYCERGTVPVEAKNIGVKGWIVLSEGCGYFKSIGARPKKERIKYRTPTNSDATITTHGFGAFFLGAFFCFERKTRE